MKTQIFIIAILAVAAYAVNVQKLSKNTLKGEHKKDVWCDGGYGAYCTNALAEGQVNV